MLLNTTYIRVRKVGWNVYFPTKLFWNVSKLIKLVVDAKKPANTECYKQTYIDAVSVSINKFLIISIKTTSNR